MPLEARQAPRFPALTGETAATMATKAPPYTARLTVSFFVISRYSRQGPLLTIANKRQFPPLRFRSLSVSVSIAFIWRFTVLSVFRTRLGPISHHSTRAMAYLLIGLITLVRCAGTQDLLKELTNAVRDAGGFGQERGDGPGGCDVFIAQPTGEALEIGNICGQFGDTAIVDQAQTVLDRAQEVVSITQLVVEPGTDDSTTPQRRQCVPEVGP